MKIEIELETSNDAFGNTPESVAQEVGSILLGLTKKLIENGGCGGCDEIRLFDTNGNRVGEYRSDEWDHYSGDEPCPINRRPKSSCPDGCDHGED